MLRIIIKQIGRYTIFYILPYWECIEKDPHSLLWYRTFYLFIFFHLVLPLSAFMIIDWINKYFCSNFVHRGFSKYHICGSF